MIVDNAGHEVVREGINLGEGITNNEAEARALWLAFQRLEQLRNSNHPLLDGPIRVFGDSVLITRFMTKVFKRPRKTSIWHSVIGTREIIKKHKWDVGFR